MGLALALGFRTRIAAISLVGFSLITAILFHAQFADQNQMIHFLKNIAIAGGLLGVAAYGAASPPLDALLRKRRLTMQTA